MKFWIIIEMMRLPKSVLKTDKLSTYSYVYNIYIQLFADNE